MITRELSVTLSESERMAKGQEIARALERFDELEEQKKADTRAIGEEMKGIRQRTKKLARQLREGREVRPVECDDVPEYRTGVMQTIRKDTGEVVETRALTMAERTPQLFDVKAREPKAKKAKPAEASGEGA